VGGRPWQVLRPWYGSAAEQARAILGDDARVVAGLHTIAAEDLQDLDNDVESDVLLCGDDAEAKARVGSLIEGIPGMRWLDCGRLEMARVTEPLTALLVSINRTYKIKDSGFRIVGRDAWGAPG
jgi:NADPH-dependent F420 reductase